MFTGYQVLKKLKGNLSVTNAPNGVIELTDLDGNVILPGDKVLNYADTYNIVKQAEEGYKINFLTINDESYLDKSTYTYLPETSLNVNVEVGTKQLESFTITTNLTECTINNNQVIAYEDTSYIATLTANENYVIRDIIITMGGVNITPSVYSNGNINIEKVTGNIEIIAVAKDINEPVITITPISNSTFEYSIYDSVGVTGYAITTTAEEPTEWVTEGDLNSGTYEVDSAGVYYIWAKDLANNIINNTITSYSITANLTNCFLEDDVRFALSNYSNTLKYGDRYKLETAQILMGGVDVTSSIFTDDVINVTLTGNLEITFMASELQSGLYQNGVLKYSWAELESRYPKAFEYPETIKGLATYDGAFETLTGDLVVDNSIYFIDDYAFAYATLSKIILPEHFVAMSHNSFYNVKSNLKYIALPNDLFYISANNVFNNSNLTSITYDNGKYFGNKLNPYMFFYKAINTSITSCTIHPNCKIINFGAFANCTSLVDLEIPDSIDAVFGNDDSNTNMAFYNCTSLNSTIYDNAKYIGNATNPYVICLKATNTSITSINFPVGVKIIADKAFYGCTKLTSVTLPNAVTCIGDTAFEAYNGTLSTLKLSSNLKMTMSGISTYSKITSLTLPESLEYMVNWSFSYNTSVTSLKIPSKIRRIGRGVFQDMFKCTSLNLGTNIHTIEYNAFRSMGISSVVFPNSLIKLENSSFEDCSKLTSVHIPSTLTNLYNNAFTKCLNLSNITVADDNPNYSDMNSNIIYELATNKVMVGAKNSTIPQGTLIIGPYSFYGNGITSLTLPEGLTTIGDHAFDDSYITSLTIPDSVTTLGTWAFNGCSKLKRLELGSGITRLNNYLFDSDTYNSIVVKFKTVTPPSVTTSNSLPYGTPTLLVPASSIYSYKTATNWTNYANYVVGYETFTAGSPLPNYADGTTYTTTTWYSNEACTTRVTSFTTDGEYYCKLS